MRNPQIKRKISMELQQRMLKWKDKLQKGGAGIELITKDEIGNLILMDNRETSIIDCLYFGIYEQGKIVAEISLDQRNEHKSDDYKTEQKELIYVKDDKKVIYVDKNDNCYGFGFGIDQPDKLQSFVLCVRIGSGIQLMWSNSTDKRINLAYEINMENPASLDCLVEFLCAHKDSTERYLLGM